MVNADEAEVKGFEVEAIWLATENLTLMANYSYIDGEYTDFCCYVDERILDPDVIHAGLVRQHPDPGAREQDLPERQLFPAYRFLGEFVPSVSYSWVDERQYDVFDHGRHTGR